MPESIIGSVLHVDLSRGSLEVEHPAESFYRTYWGGSALGMFYLLKHTPPNADPLGPDNTLTFALSAPTGLPLAASTTNRSCSRSAVPRSKKSCRQWISWRKQRTRKRWLVSVSSRVNKGRS